VKYLAIKNWRKFQTIEDGKPAEYVKDYTAKDSDLDRMKLSVFQAGVLDRLHRLRALTGRILHNDITWIIQATHIPRRDAPHVAHAIRTLTERNFIIPTNDENFEGSIGHRREEESREEVLSRERGEVAPRSGASLQEEKDKTPEAPERRERQPQQPPSPSAAPKECRCPDGLCDWSEPISGCARPASVGDAVYYERHVKRNQYFIERLSRGYVLQQWKRLLNDTPEDFAYDPEPMFKERTVHLDAGETTVIKEVMRRPKNAKERSLLLQKDPSKNAKWLYDPACPRGCNEGAVSVSDYPGDPTFSKLTHTELCECVTRDEHRGPSA
jgi:hypothetical protein